MALVTPLLAGGLGNLLFQLAGCYGLAKKHALTFFINTHMRHPAENHSKTDYFAEKNFLSRWVQFHKPIRGFSRSVVEQDLNPIQLPQLRLYDILYIHGYFQNYEYFWRCRDEIINLLTFDTSIRTKYSALDTSAFIHVRGGDYVNHPIHFINLSNYYTKAIQHVKASHYYIFTNDEVFLNTQTWLKDINYTIVRENEVDSLYLMSQCQRGAICANSTFSWWGAYLNLNRTICMPSKWFTESKNYIQGYFFPGVTVIEV